VPAWIVRRSWPSRWCTQLAVKRSEGTVMQGGQVSVSGSPVSCAGHFAMKGLGFRYVHLRLDRRVRRSIAVAAHAGRHDLGRFSFPVYPFRVFCSSQATLNRARVRLAV